MKKIRIKTLDCGVRVVTEKISHLNSAAFGIWVKAGAVDETRENAGISHFIEHMMFKGTEKRSAKQIAEDIDRIGGQINAFTGKEATCYYVKTISTNLEKGAEVLLDMLSDSVFNAREMGRERNVIYEEIKMNEDQPDDVAHDKAVEAVFRGTPLGNDILGTKTSLAGISRRVITEHKKNYYTKDSVVISVCGNFDEERFCEYLEDKFDKLLGKRPERKNIIMPYEPRFTSVVKDIQQTHICLAAKGICTSDERFYSLAVLTNIMGGSMSSRLFQNIREKKGLAYSVYAISSSFSVDGYFLIYAGVGHDKIADALKGIKEELRLLDRDGITEDELSMSREQIKAGYIFGEENPMNRMFANGKNLLLLDTVYTTEDMIKGVDAVSAESIDEVKKIICDPELYSIGCASNKKVNLKSIWV